MKKIVFLLCFLPFLAQAQIIVSDTVKIIPIATPGSTAKALTDSVFNTISGITSESNLYRASAVGTGYSVNDLIEEIKKIDLRTTTPSVLSTLWRNLTINTNLASAPTSGTVFPVVGGTVVGTGVATSAGVLIVTLGGTAQTLFAANTNRNYIEVENTSNGTLYINEFGTATLASKQVLPGERRLMYAMGTSIISILGQTTGQTFLAKEVNNPSIGGTTFNIQTAAPSGGSTRATSYPFDLASNSTVDAQKEYQAMIAGTGYVVGDRLMQTIKSVGGVFSETWFNLTQKTIMTTPTAALIATDLSPYSPVQLSDKRAVNKWYLSYATFNGGTANTVLAIRNTNTFPVRISSFEMSANTNVIQTTGNTLNIPLTASIGTSPTTITGGTALQVSKVTGSGTYTSDASIAALGFYTSSTQANLYTIAGWTQYIPSYATGGTAGLQPSQGYLNLDFAKGTIIPAGGTFLVQGTGFTGLPSSSYINFAIVLTEL
jgi:hypothetical protein